MIRARVGWFGVAWTVATVVASAMVFVGSTDALLEAMLVFLLPYVLRELARADRDPASFRR